MRLVNIDDVLDIICKYENRNIQKMMVYKVGCLPSVEASEKQFLEIVGEQEMVFDDKG